MFLNFKLNFQEHFDNMLHKVNKTIGLLRKLQSIPMFKRIMHVFSKKQKTFSLMQAQPLQELYVKHLGKFFLKNQAWSLCNTGACTESTAALIKFGKANFQNIFFNIIPKFTGPQSTRKTNSIPHFKVEHSFFKI